MDIGGGDAAFVSGRMPDIFSVGRAAGAVLLKGNLLIVYHGLCHIMLHDIVQTGLFR